MSEEKTMDVAFIELDGVGILNSAVAGISIEEIRRLLGSAQAPFGRGLRNACLIAHSDEQILGFMRLGFPQYPEILAEAPVVTEDSAFAAVTESLLTALKQHAIKSCRLQVEVIQDVNPATDTMAHALQAHGFREIGRSIYMSKEIGPEPSSIHPPIEIVSARDAGMDTFLRAMMDCAQPPLLDPRLQPKCQSPEGVSLVIRDMAGRTSSSIEQFRENCHLAYLDGNVVAVAIASAGFVSWLVVNPGARRHGVGRAVLQSLEKRWLDQGITHAGLQVMSTNQGAAALYRSLGYASHGEQSPHIWKWSVRSLGD
jgi:hypothetical protein